jgi:hypothetical protein
LSNDRGSKLQHYFKNIGVRSFIQTGAPALSFIWRRHFAGCFAKFVFTTFFSNLAMALSASLLVRAKYLSRISWARRKLCPVIATISGTVQPASASIVTVMPHGQRSNLVTRKSRRDRARDGHIADETLSAFGTQRTLNSCYWPTSIYGYPAFGVTVVA